VLVLMELEPCEEKLVWEQKALELVREGLVLVRKEAQVLVQME
jgi:hypothetical protein